MGLGVMSESVCGQGQGCKEKLDPGVLKSVQVSTRQEQF